MKKDTAHVTKINNKGHTTHRASNYTLVQVTASHSNVQQGHMTKVPGNTS